MLKPELIKLSRKLGFSLIGFCSPEIDNSAKSMLKKWIYHHYNANMKYMADTVGIRTDISKLLPDVKTVIMFGLAYNRNYKKVKINKNKIYGKVARYSLIRDYHNTFRSLFKRFIKCSKPLFEKYGYNNIKIVGGSDSKPIPERYYAVKSGLGFIGNNGCLITKKFGSFVLLGTLLVNIKITPDKPVAGTCGTCKRCMITCPGKAIVEPHIIDANKCIAYWTIEHRGPFPKNVAIKDHLFGCDVCQEVCPYNKCMQPTPVMPLDEILRIKTKEEFEKRFAGTPFMRAKLEGMRRNANAIVLRKNL